jgi:CotH kinase protein/Chitobiase/beta-hexosaminidase C-terminal domain
MIPSVGDIAETARFARRGLWAFYALCAVAAFSAADLASANDDASEPAPPLFSIAGGVYTNDVTLELKAGAAEVRFATDGSEPGLSSPVFTGPLRITNCAVVRAKAWYPDGRTSRTASQTYTLLADDLFSFSSNLPLIIINHGSGEIPRAEKSLAGARVMWNKTGRTTLLSQADFDGLALLNVRGHSSLRYPKHSYNVKLVNERRDFQKVSILGLPKESDWALYGPYPDKTLLRDVLAFELSNKMGQWAPHIRFVEVFINETASKLGMGHYAGVYVFQEKVTRDKSRVDIAKLDPSENREPEISGGYIFKKDHSGRFERKKFPTDGPPQAGSSSTNRVGYPTPPRGFPADPAGFLPPYQSRSSTSATKTPRSSSFQERLNAIVEKAELEQPTLGTNANPAATNTVARSTFRERLRAVLQDRAQTTGQFSVASLPARKPKTVLGPSRPVTNYVPVAVPEGTRIDQAKVFRDDESFRTTMKRNQFYFYEPEPDEITAVQRAWLKDYVNRFESALHGPDFADPTKGYLAFIDADSFIDHHLLVEVTKNVDGFRFSTFYYKDRGGRLKMGPAWDWNLSFGNASGKQGWLSEYWLWPQLDDQQYSWFRRLFEDPDFGQRYVDRWAQLRTNVLATSNLLARIDELAGLLNEAQARNFARWEILGRDINPNWYVGDSYSDEIEWMKQWIAKRLAWVENQFLPAPAALPGRVIELSSTIPEAKIYFTLDGSDPRAPGGAVSGAARAYQSPVSPPADVRLFARVQSGTRWSAPTLLLPSQR